MRLLEARASNADDPADVSDPTKPIISSENPFCRSFTRAMPIINCRTLRSAANQPMCTEFQQKGVLNW